jgi:hypothetical protein
MTFSLSISVFWLSKAKNKSEQKIKNMSLCLFVGLFMKMGNKGIF